MGAARLTLGDGVVADLFIEAKGDARRWTFVSGTKGSLLFDEVEGTLKVLADEAVASVSGWKTSSLVAALESADCVLQPSFSRAWTHPGLERMLSAMAEKGANVEVGRHDALRAELRAFYDAIRFSAPLPTDVHDGYRVVAALEAVDEWKASKPPTGALCAGP